MRPSLSPFLFALLLILPDRPIVLSRPSSSSSVWPPCPCVVGFEVSNGVVVVPGPGVGPRSWSAGFRGGGGALASSVGATTRTGPMPSRPCGRANLGVVVVEGVSAGVAGGCFDRGRVGVEGSVAGGNVAGGSCGSGGRGRQARYCLPRRACQSAWRRSRVAATMVCSSVPNASVDLHSWCQSTTNSGRELCSCSPPLPLMCPVGGAAAR